MTSSSLGVEGVMLNLAITLLVVCSPRTGLIVVEGQQQFVVRPESVSVMQGEDVLLSCVVDRQQGRVQWTKDGFALGFERHVPGYPRYTYLGDASRGEHHLAISRVSFTDDGEYQCQVGPTPTTPPIWAAANVTVLMAPSSIRVEGYRNGDVVEVAAGSTLHLRCTVPGARPPPSLTWYMQDTQIAQGQMRTQVVRSSAEGKWDVVSQLVVRARAEDDGKNVSCHASHPGIRGMGIIATSVTLSVPHRPKVPVISGYKTGNDLTVGKHLSLICRVTGGNPVPSLQWYRNEQLLDDTFGLEQPGSRVTANALDIVVQERDDGAEYECRATSPLLTRPLVAATTLSVHYGPGSVRVTGPSRVEEGGTVSLRCQATEAKPAASLSWFVNGKAVASPGLLVSQVDSGGWLSSSQLVKSVEGEQENGQVVVECRAAHPALTHSLHHTLIITVVKSAGAPVLEGDVLGEVLSGSSVPLVCSSPGSQNATTLRVYKKGQVVATEMVQEGDMTRALARLRITPADNGALVKCEVTSHGSKTPKVTSVRLKVLFGPRDVSGSAVPSVADEGSIVTLTCLTSSSNPPANITWYSEGTRLHPDAAQVSPSAFSGSSSRSELQLTVTPEDNGRTFTCQADNGLASPLQKKMRLTVLHAPVWKEVPAPQVNVWEGSEVSVSATAVANPGPVRYWWRRGRKMLVGAGGQLRLGQATRDMTANYTISAYSRRGAINNTFLLNVQYGPENLSAPERVAVSMGENVNIRCSATGNPVPHLIWTNKNQTLGSGVGVARLVLPSVHPEDTGVYLCVATSNSSHTHPTAATKLIVTQAASVSKETGFTRGSWVSVGGHGRLVCHVKAHPPPDFTWTFGGRRIYSDSKFTILDPELVDGLVAWMSVLEVADVTPMDYRTYLCSASNTLGSDSTSITLRPPTRPLPPTDLKVISVTNVTVTLGWVPNMTGGIPESYTVRYKIASTLDYQYEYVNNTTEVTVGGLQPGQEYLITTRAANTQGSSDYVTPPLTFTTSGETVVDDGSSELDGEGHQLTSLLLLAIILAAVGLIALNVAIVICLLRRFRRKRNSIRSTDSSTKTTSVTTTHANTSSSSPDSHQHQHTHHHHLLSTFAAAGATSKPFKNHKRANHVRKGDNEDVSLTSATPSLNQKLRTNSKDKSKIQIRAGKKMNRKLSHNCSRVQDIPGYTESNNNGNSSHFTQAQLLGNGNGMSLSRTTRKKSPSVSPEARSLIPHSQGRVSLHTTPMMAQNDPEDDNQASDTSNESTETAIYLDNISPPPRPNINAQQMHKDARIVLSSQSAAQQYTDGTTQHTWQNEPSTSTTDKNGPQAGIMTELENAIMQRREQAPSQIHAPGEPAGLPDNEQLMFPQSILQPLNQMDRPEPERTAFSHLVHASTNVASHNILTRAQQLSEVNHQNSTLAQHRHWKKLSEGATAPHHTLSPAPSAEGDQQNMVTISPGRQKRLYQPSSPSQHQAISPGRIPNLPVQIKSPTVQHYVTSSSNLSPGVRQLQTRHPSSIRTELNSPSRSQSQVKQQTPPPLTPKHTPPLTPDSNYSHSPQLRHKLNQTEQPQKPPSPSKRSSHSPLPPPPPLTRVRHQPSMSPQNSGQQQQSSFTLSHQLPNSPPGSFDPSWQHLPTSPVSSFQHLPTSSPSFSQYHPPSSAHKHPTQTLSSPSSSQHYLTSSISASPLHHLPPTPPGSIPRRPPPRLRHQQPPSLSPATDRLPLSSPSMPGSHHPTHIHTSQFTQAPRPIHSRQQNRISEFRKSISRSLEDYHSHAATRSERNQGHKNSAATQEGNLHAKHTLRNSSAVSTSLPKDIHWRADTHADHEAYGPEMGQPPRRSVHTLVDDNTPAATSSPITSRRRRSRFPDDFLWQGSSGKM